MRQAGSAISASGLFSVLAVGISFQLACYPRFREDRNSSILAFTCLYFWSCTK